MCRPVHSAVGTLPWVDVGRCRCALQMDGKGLTTMPSENRDLLPGQTTGGKRPGFKKYGKAALRDGLPKEECLDRNLQESVTLDKSGISYKNSIWQEILIPEIV
ncbi:hypothetical protein DPMN_134855 [Dreissena polymorpha]|uniref:Uncharacterized protein n=1 Tax=Dreissena polymorpha TaxID=45954 RepID=A0A9D4G0G6_DREPO|nr:hypothetical protein DPMN_134854 [Dreissena polymorpha]KAH3806532.1 hypothetical protein DPMN_134855 [Dreissena polymorpha]